MHHSIVSIATTHFTIFMKSLFSTETKCLNFIVEQRNIGEQLFSKIVKFFRHTMCKTMLDGEVPIRYMIPFVSKLFMDKVH